MVVSPRVPAVYVILIDEEYPDSPEADTSNPDGAVTVMVPDSGERSVPESEYVNSFDAPVWTLPNDIDSGKMLNVGIPGTDVVPEITTSVRQTYFEGLGSKLYHG
jgi:hypothetical protein